MSGGAMTRRNAISHSSCVQPRELCIWQHSKGSLADVVSPHYLQCSDLPSGKQETNWTMDKPNRSHDTSILLSAGNHLEVHSSTWNLVGTECSVPPGGLQKVLGCSSMDEEGLNTILVSTEVELSSGPISQNDNEEVLTPVHFLVGELSNTKWTWITEDRPAKRIQIGTENRRRLLEALEQTIFNVLAGLLIKYDAHMGNRPSLSLEMMSSCRKSSNHATPGRKHILKSPRQAETDLCAPWSSPLQMGMRMRGKSNWSYLLRQHLGVDDVKEHVS